MYDGEMTILDDIVENKKRELEHSLPNKQLFIDTFASKQTLGIIAEVKITSPSFDLSEKIDPDNLITSYGKNNNIRGISILIDKKYFKGDIARATQAKEYNKPLFFKEFIIDYRQIDGAAYFGYDGVLLLKRILTNDQIHGFVLYANSKNIYPIIEVDNAKDLEDILTLQLPINYGIAVNCRDLGTMKIDRKRHFEYYEMFKDEYENHTMFAFSGIESIEQTKEYEGKYNGVLLGTSLVEKFI